MFKRFKDWLNPPSEILLNGGLALNHFRDAEYRNVLGHDIHECRFELKKLLDKYNCGITVDAFHSVYLYDIDTDEKIQLMVIN